MLLHIKWHCTSFSPPNHIWYNESCIRLSYSLAVYIKQMTKYVIIAFHQCIWPHRKFGTPDTESNRQLENKCYNKNNQQHGIELSQATRFSYGGSFSCSQWFRRRKRHTFYRYNSDRIPISLHRFEWEMWFRWVCLRSFFVCTSTYSFSFNF